MRLINRPRTTCRFPNCRQTVLTNLGFSWFWRRTSELRTFFEFFFSWLFAFLWSIILQYCGNICINKSIYIYLAASSNLYSFFYSNKGPPPQIFSLQIYLSIIHNKVRKLFTDSSAKKCRTCSKFGSSAIPEVVWALLINIDIE